MTGDQDNTVVIRPADRNDAGRLSLISNATFLETFAGMVEGDALLAHCETAHMPDRLARALEGGARAWLAEIQRSPIGYALLGEPDLAASREGDIELKKIYLLSRFHGSGVAARLLDEVLVAAREKLRLLLGVKADNARAIAFYTKQGFEQIATRRFDVGGTLYDDVVLAREIEQDR